MCYDLGSMRNTPEQEISELATDLPGMETRVTCPMLNKLSKDESWVLHCRGGQTDLMRVMIHLNDHHKWTREQIADWLVESELDADFEREVFNDNSN